MKTCCYCKVSKPVEQYHKDSKRHLGVASACKECARARALKSRWDRIEEVRSHDRARYHANPGPKRERSREQWMSMTNEQKRAHRERQKQLDAEAPEDLREVRRAANAERQRRRTVRLRGAFVEPICTLLVLERDDGVCGICGDDVDPTNFHIDHIVPVARGGEHSYANTQVAHPKCNLSKGARMGVERS